MTSPLQEQVGVAATGTHWDVEGVRLWESTIPDALLYLARDVRVSATLDPGRALAEPGDDDAPSRTLMVHLFYRYPQMMPAASRRLGAEEVNVAVLVYPDARLEIRTTADALGELSTAGEMLGRRAQPEAGERGLGQDGVGQAAIDKSVLAHRMDPGRCSALAVRLLPVENGRPATLCRSGREEGVDNGCLT